MLIRRAAGGLSVAGAVVAFIMGVWLVGVNLAVEVLDPLRGLGAGLSALAAAVVGLLGCLLFFRRHVTSGLVLMTAAVCEAAFVQPPFAAPLLGLGGLLALVAFREPSSSDRTR